VLRVVERYACGVNSCSDETVGLRKGKRLVVVALPGRRDRAKGMRA